MGNKQFAKNPLLYIQQPTISTPIAPMQHNYYNAKHQQHSTEQTERKAKRIIPLKRNYSIQPEEIIDADSQEETSNELSPQNKFKDMTIKEKVNYFLNRSDHAPSIKCEIKTKERKYYGVITGFEDNQVFIQIGRRSSSSKVALNDITNIRIIGF